MAFTGFNYNFPADFTYASLENKHKYLDIWKEAIMEQLVEYLTSLNQLPDLDKYSLNLYIIGTNMYPYPDSRGSYSAWVSNANSRLYYKVVDLVTDDEVSGQFAIPKNLFNINILTSNQVFMYDFLSLMNINSSASEPTCKIHWSKYDIKLVCPTNYDSLSITQKEIIDNKMKAEFETKLKALINIRHKDYGGWNSFADYVMNFFHVTTNNNLTAYGTYPSKFFAYSDALANINLVYNNTLSYNYLKYRAILTILKNPKVGISSILNTGEKTISSSFYSSDKGLVIYFKDIKILNTSNPFTVFQRIFNVSLNTSQAIPKDSLILTYNISFEIRQNKPIYINDLSLDISLPADFSSKITTEKNKIMEDRIIKLKDFIINKWNKLYKIIPDNKYYASLDIITYDNVSYNGNFGTQTVTTWGDTLALNIYSNSARTTLISSFAFKYEDLATVDSDGGLDVYLTGSSGSTAPANWKTITHSTLNKSLAANIIGFNRNFVIAVKDFLLAKTIIQLNSFLFYNLTPNKISAVVRKYSHNFVYDGRQYVGNPSLFLKPTVNIPSGEYRRDEFPLVVLTNQSPSMHSFPRKYKSLNNKTLNNTTPVCKLYKNTIIKDGKLYIYQNKATSTNTFLEIDLNTLTFKELILNGAYLGSNSTALDNDTHLFEYKNKLFITGGYAGNDSTLTGNTMYEVKLNEKQLIAMSYATYHHTGLPESMSHIYGLSNIIDSCLQKSDPLKNRIFFVSDKFRKIISKVARDIDDNIQLGNYTPPNNFGIQPNTTYSVLSTSFETTPYHLYEDNFVLYGLCTNKLLVMNIYDGVHNYLDLPRTRQYGTIIVKNNIIYLIGGLGEDNEPLFCIDQYDIEKGIWLDPWDYTAAIKIEDRPSYKIQSKWVNIPGTSKYVQVHKETENDYTCLSFMEIAKSTIMYYTTDGSDPKDKNNLNRVKYTGPFNIKPSGTKTTTVKVRAYTDVE